jgi:hypothetical protein
MPSRPDKLAATLMHPTPSKFEFAGGAQHGVPEKQTIVLHSHSQCLPPPSGNPGLLPAGA